MITTTIHLSDILNSQRIDVAYYKDNLGTNDFVSLSKYVDIKGGKRIPKDKSFSFEDTNYLYLRLSDITDFENINYSALKNIDEELFNTLKRYEICNNEIVFSIAGTIGRVFVVRNIPKGKRVILTENCAKLLPKNDNILPEYISLLLNCDFVHKQIEQNRIQTTIPKIGLDRIAKLKVPELPSFNVQQEIAELYQKAQTLRLKKEQEAKQILHDIDNYILEALGINKHHNEPCEAQLRKVSSLIGERLDVTFHKSIENVTTAIKKIAYMSLGEIAEMSSEGWDQKSLFTDVFPYVEISAIDIVGGVINNIDYMSIDKVPSRAKKIVRKNDILISTTRPNRGAICIYDEEYISIASTGFSIVRHINNCVLREYLYLILRSSLSLEQMAIRSSGGNYPAITETELKRILVPIPSLDVQKDIVDTVFGMKAKATELQKTGAYILEKIKQKIERLILK